MGQLQSQNWLYRKQSYEKKKKFCLNLSSMVKFRFKIRFYDIVAVPASDHPVELPPVHESSQ